MAINKNYKIQQALTMTAKTQQQRRADVLAKYEASGCKSILAHYNQLKREAGGEFMSYNRFVGIINRARDDRHKAQIAKEDGKK